MILLKNGRIIDPDTNLDMIGDVLIEKDRIIDIADNIDIGENEAQVIDCSGCVVGPGLVDIHVHFRDPGFTYNVRLRAESHR